MSRVFFIQASLAVKNRWGHKQLFMEKDSSGDALLKFLICNVRLVKNIDKVCVVTSDLSIDDEVVSLVNDLAKDTSLSLKPLMLYRVSSDKPYAFSDQNIASEKLLNNVPLYGFYSANGAVDICEDIACDQCVFLPAENDIVITNEYIDRILNKYGDEDVFVKPLSIFITAEVKKFLRQYLIKQSKDNNVLLSNIGVDIEGLRQLNLYSDGQIKEITKLKKTNFSKTKAAENININIILGYIHDKQRKKDVDFRDFRNATPLLNSIHLKELISNIDFLKDITIDKFIDFLTNPKAKQGQKIYPGYLEVELTSKCNRTCQDCPQTKFTRSKEDMSLDVFKQIVDETVDYVPFLALSGYGEPLLNPNIIEAVNYAKSNGFFRVLLETNASLLDDVMLNSLSNAGLDIISLNLNAIDGNVDFKREELPSSSIIKRILDFNDQNRDKAFSLVLQVVKTVDNDELVEFYYKRFEYIVDKIVIRSFNDFLGKFSDKQFVDFSPLEKDRKMCAKTAHSLFVSSTGKPHICMQQFDQGIEGEKDLLTVWQENRNRGGHFDFCSNCKQWHMLDSYSYSLLHGLDISFIEDYIYKEVVPKNFEEGKLFYENKDYEKALDIWESVLKIYPHHKQIHSYLDQILKEK